MELHGYTDLSARTKLRLTGGDRIRYLNGQVTNDVRKATPQEPVYALVPTVKGKTQADVFISPEANRESLLIDGPASMREELFARLDRYLIADDAELSDVTDEFQMLHLLGESLELPDVWQRSVNRFGQPGIDLIAAADLDLVGLLSGATNAPALTEEQLEELRIIQGVPMWGEELDETVLPQEALLQDRAVDFQKGCYIGQEVISRIKSAGKVNRQLVAFVTVEEDAALEPDMELLAGEKVVGKVTSAIFSPSVGRNIGLGYAKGEFSKLGTQLVGHSQKNNLSSTLEIRETPLT